MHLSIEGLRFLQIFVCAYRCVHTCSEKSTRIHWGIDAVMLTNTNPLLNCKHSVTSY